MSEKKIFDCLWSYNSSKSSSSNSTKKRKNSAKTAENMVTNVLKNTGTALEIEASNGSVVAPKNPKTGLSARPEVKNLNQIGKRLYLEKFAYFEACKWP